MSTTDDRPGSTKPWPASVVFDFDGLLIDTETTLLASWEHEWAQWGLTLDRTTFFADHGGDTSAQRYAELAKAVGSTYDRELSHIRRTAFRESLHICLDLRPGIRDWLTDATARGISLAIASSSSRAWVEGHLQRLGLRDRFAVLACGDEVHRAKPAPDVYTLALDKLATANDDALAVEDTPHGVAAAHAAGLRVVAIPNPHVDKAGLHRADLVLDSAADETIDAVARLVRHRPSPSAPHAR